MSDKLQQQLRVATTPEGRPVAIVDTIIPDDAPAEVREGLARRALTNRGQDCPCGAQVILPSRAERRRRKGEVIVVRVEHESDCPAITDTLLAAIRQWRGGEVR